MEKRSLLGLALIFGLAQVAFSSVMPYKDNKKTLVLLDSWATIETHSIFFDILKRSGHTLTFEMATNNPPEIKYYEEYFFNNMIIMAPSIKELKNPLGHKEIIDFVQAGHNLMVFGDRDTRKALKNLANEFGIDYENIGFTLYDSENEFSRSNSDAIFSSNIFEPLTDTSKQSQKTFSRPQKSNPIAYSGIGQINDPNNQFVFPILRAEQSTYSFNKGIEQLANTKSGEEIVLVSGYQTRHNERASFSGSISMCSNHYFLMTVDEEGTIQSSSNYQFCKELALWTF